VEENQIITISPIFFKMSNPPADNSSAIEIYRTTLRLESMRLTEPLSVRFMERCEEVQRLNPDLPLEWQVKVARVYLHIIIDNIDGRYHD
jgi:hypothetical protein